MEPLLGQRRHPLTRISPLVLRVFEAAYDLLFQRVTDQIDICIGALENDP
jgi:hypothetical protein